MDTTTETAKKSLGDNKAERTPSATYTIKSLAGNIKKLEKLKMCKPDELNEIKKIYKTVKERWIALELDV